MKNVNNRCNVLSNLLKSIQNQNLILMFFYWMFKVLQKNPHAFVNMAVDSGLNIIKKMTNVEADAMWVKANVSYDKIDISFQYF